MSTIRAQGMATTSVTLEAIMPLQPMIPYTAPSARPMTVATAARVTDSQATIERTCPLVMPSARSSPSSRVRSSTERLSVLPTPITAMMTATASRAVATIRTTSMICWYFPRATAPLVISAP